MKTKSPVADEPLSAAQTLTAPQAGNREPWGSPRLIILSADQTAAGSTPGGDGQSQTYEANYYS